ncbi:hypothetical protein ACLOJK_015831 [Asimina triloba]
MALKIQTPAALRARNPSCSSSIKRSCTRRPVIAMRAGSDHHPEAATSAESSSTRKFSPSLSAVTADGIASSLGHELNVLELERLFNKSGKDVCLPPQFAGPSFPSPVIEFPDRRPVRVAYQGVLGSYCQEAAVKAFSSACEAFPCSNMEEAFQALKENAADRAIIPIENSIDGSIERNFDLLLRHEDVKIVGETIIPVNHCLLAMPGASTNCLKRILSHPQALSHCKEKLEGQFPHVEIQEVPNAADAACYVSEDRIADTAVIGSKIASREFGLQLLEQNFQDPYGNFNRFLHLGLEYPAVLKGTEHSKGWKTTIAFSLNKGVSDLFWVLWQFESRKVNVLRVDHRPNRASPVRVVEKETGKVQHLDYVFILDLEGNVSDSRLGNAIKHLKEIAGFVRVLGSYTRALQC